MPKARTTRAIGRKRRTLGWLLFTLGALVAGAWVASRWLYVIFGRGEHFATLTSGVLQLQPTNPNPNGDDGLSWFKSEDPRWDLLASTHSAMWNVAPPKWDVGIASDTDVAQYGTVIVLTLWPIPLLLWTPAALLLRSSILARRRARKGICIKCGYSLAGLGAGTPCPECGKGAT